MDGCICAFADFASSDGGCGDDGLEEHVSRPVSCSFDYSYYANASDFDIMAPHQSLGDHDGTIYLQLCGLYYGDAYGYTCQ